MTKMMQQLGTRPRVFLLTIAAIAVMGVSACGDDDHSNNGTANNGAGDTGDVQMDAGADADDGGTDATDGGTDATDGGTDATDGGTDATDGGEDATDGGEDATDGGEDATDLCVDVTCEAPEPTCDDIDTVLSYSGAGTCDPADGTCDYSGVEVLTDCATGEECSLGTCIDPTDHSVGVGDLVITEIMNNPSAVNDGDGEYFEVYNTTARTLHLNGLEIKDDGSDTFTVTDPNTDPIEVAPNAYFVFGVNDGSTDPNGGVTVDYVYSGMSLANGDDEVVIVNGTDEIDRVNYDDGATFPDPTGASMQFGTEYDVANNDDGTNWCLSRDAIDPSATETDLGTPGAANVNCVLPTAVISIYDLKDETSADHPTPGQSVDIDGVVVTAVDTDDTTSAIEAIWVQDPAGGEWSGAYVDMSNVTATVAVGDNVDVEGTYEVGGWPQLDLKMVVATDVTANSNTDTVTAQPVDASVLADEATAAAWEGVLLELAEPAVTNENPDGPGDDFMEFRVDGALRVDDQLFDYTANDPTNCDTFDTLTGVLYRLRNENKLLPREAGDIAAQSALASSGATGTVAIASNAYNPADVCVDNGATVTWTNADTADHTVTDRDPVSDDAASTPLFDHAVSGAAGTASETFADAGTYHYLCTIHPTMTGRVIVLE